MTVEPLGPLRSYLKARTSPAPIELGEGATVSEALGFIGIPSTASWNASIDGTLVYADQVLKDGDHLLVFAPIAGGCD
ncbi:MAG: MoaD/ThiS family protein [Chloroflexi bacterium]|nr:MoaD/ThiS family protein [Chloroflexota bacterium]